MFSNIRHISVKGGKFLTNTNFELFSENRNVRVIYGRNGSGKSTITKSILNISNDNDPTISGKFLDNSMNEVCITEDMSKNIFVFNEEYIEKNIKLKEDGLGTIVMFGEQSELDLEIDEIEKKISDKKEQKDIFDKSLELLIQKKEDTIKIIFSSLKGDDNWAGKDKDIRKNKTNSSVTLTLVKDIASQNPKKNLEDSITAFNEEKERYLKMINTENLSSVNPISNFLQPIDDNLFIHTLSKKVDKPVLTNRELKIFDFVSSGKQSFYNDVKNNVINPNFIECPYCFQKITPEYKEELLANLIKVFNTEVEEHIFELKNLKLNSIIFDFSKFRDVNFSLAVQCEDNLNTINSSIQKYNTFIENKINNIFEPFEITSLNICTKILELSALINKFNSEIISYNSQLKALELFKENIIKLNKEIAYYKIIDLYNNYCSIEKDILTNKSHITDLETEIRSLDSNKNILISKKNNIKIAISHINSALNYIFFTKNKLSLKEGNSNSYKLFSNNLEVKPSNISCGERNALALSYFFTQILNNSSKDNFYTNQMLLVIDDPISSFDVDNKIGIFSYLKSQFSNILKGNEGSKILIFTHDLPSMLSFKRIFSEFYISNHLKTLFFEMSHDNTLIKFERPSEYQSLLKRIYSFAQNPNQDDIIIGNSIRRVLEAFSTFTYKKSTEQISTDDNILSQIGDHYKKYFKNYMYKLFLHGESHFEETVSSNLEMTFTEITSVDEKKRIARDIICFMYLLNKNHVLAYLENIPEINDWCNDIANTISD